MKSRWEDKEREQQIEEKDKKEDMKIQEEKPAGLKWALNNDEAQW